MNLTNFKNLGLTAYEYFWKAIPGKYAHMISESVFLKGSVLVPKYVATPYSFNKKIEPVQYLKNDYSFFDEGKGYEVSAVYDGEEEPFKNDSKTSTHAVSFLILRDKQSKVIDALILPSYEGTGYLLWLRLSSPFKSSNIWKPIESFEELAIVRQNIENIKNKSSNNWPSTYVIEEDFSPVFNKALASKVSLTKGEKYLVIADFYYCFVITEISDLVFLEIDNYFSHFKYLIFSPERFLITIEDGWFTVQSKKNLT